MPSWTGQDRTLDLSTRAVRPPFLEWATGVRECWRSSTASRTPPDWCAGPVGQALSVADRTKPNSPRGEGSEESHSPICWPPSRWAPASEATPATKPEAAIGTPRRPNRTPHLDHGFVLLHRATTVTPLTGKPKASTCPTCQSRATSGETTKTAPKTVSKLNSTKLPR